MQNPLLVKIKDDSRFMGLCILPVSAIELHKDLEVLKRIKEFFFVNVGSVSVRTHKW